MQLANLLTKLRFASDVQNREEMAIVTSFELTLTQHRTTQHQMYTKNTNHRYRLVLKTHAHTTQSKSH
jgi:hypothetical protein